MDICPPKIRWSEWPGRWRHAQAEAASFRDLIVVGTGYSYLQEFLPNVAQAAVRDGWTDMVGLGRMVLTYPEILLDAVEWARRCIASGFAGLSAIAPPPRAMDCLRAAIRWTHTTRIQMFGTRLAIAEERRTGMSTSSKA